MSRRGFLHMTSAVASATAGCESNGNGGGVRSPVAVLKAESYDADLVGELVRGTRLCGLDVRDKRVLLKPNLVEFDPANCINTDVAVLAAAVELFERLGAAQVLIGEGPGHRRDTLHLASEARYRDLIPRFDTRFVDLNLDEAAPVQVSGGKVLYVSRTALEADLTVSIPKMKTHHWAGATLSMKNLFGTVPGAVYGWPKNWLHYHGIHRSVADLARVFRRSFAIVDGIIGMEGNGPIQGAPKRGGVLVMGADLVAVDATCCRVMGMNPLRIEYIRRARDFGSAEVTSIDQRGECPSALRTDFDLMAPFRGLRAAGEAGRPPAAQRNSEDKLAEFNRVS